MRIFSVLLCCVLCVLTLVAGRIYTVRRMPTGVGFEAKLEWATQLTGFRFAFTGGNRLTDFWNFGVDSGDPVAVQREFARRVSLLECELQSPDDYHRWLCLVVNMQQKNELTLERLDAIERRHAGHWNLASELTMLSTRCSLKPQGPKWGRAEFEQSLLALCRRHEKEQWDLRAWRMVFYQLFGTCQNRGELLDCYLRWREVAPQQLGWRNTLDSCLLDMSSSLFTQKDFLQYTVKELKNAPKQSFIVAPGPTLMP